MRGIAGGSTNGNCIFFNEPLDDGEDEGEGEEENSSGEDEEDSEERSRKRQGRDYPEDDEEEDELEDGEFDPSIIASQAYENGQFIGQEEEDEDY